MVENVLVAADARSDKTSQPTPSVSRSHSRNASALENIAAMYKKRRD